MAACCVVTLLPAAGAAAARRAPGDPEVQTQQYLYSHGVDTWHYTVSTEEAVPALVFTPRPRDKWVHLAADDALGKGVLVHVYQRGDAGGRDLKEVFCGEVNIYGLVSRNPVEVHVFSGACPNHDFGFATAGTVTATFSPSR